MRRALVALTLLVLPALAWAGSPQPVYQHPNAMPWTIGHISAAVHVAGTVKVDCVTGCAGAPAGGQAVNQSGAWTVQAAHQGGAWNLDQVNHIKSALVHVVGTVTMEGRGAAGTPAGGVLSVQGVASGTAVPVSGTVTATGPLTDTQLRATPVPVSGTVTTNQGATPMVVAHVSSTLHVAGTVQANITTGTLSCPSRAAFSQTASAQLIAGVAGQRVLICGIVLVSASAQSVSVVEGTGTVCATGIAAVIGGTTASLSLADQGGFSTIAAFPWLATATAGNALCLLQSGTGNVSGVLTYRMAS